MPRGIPKDPNHPRNNKKKDVATSAAPKRRGRPPGSKNVVKGQATSAPNTVPKSSATPKVSKQLFMQSVATNNNDNIFLLRENIRALATVDSGIAGHALQTQIDQLLKLTSAAIGDTDNKNYNGIEEDPIAPTQVTQAPPVQSLPSPPSFAPPPFPPHLPG